MPDENTRQKKKINTALTKRELRTKVKPKKPRRKRNWTRIRSTETRTTATRTTIRLTATKKEETEITCSEKRAEEKRQFIWLMRVAGVSLCVYYICCGHVCLCHVNQFGFYYSGVWRKVVFFFFSCALHLASSLCVVMCCVCVCVPFLCRLLSGSHIFHAKQFANEVNCEFIYSIYDWNFFSSSSSSALAVAVAASACRPNCPATQQLPLGSIWCAIHPSTQRHSNLLGYALAVGAQPRKSAKSQICVPNNMNNFESMWHACLATTSTNGHTNCFG